MLDQYGRQINYLRLSVTDRCNLRCRYCMPEEGVPLTEHSRLLRYEEMLRLAEAAVSLGIDRFKITGGEPLTRRDCLPFIAELKRLPGVRQVTLTTNGLLLPQALPQLVQAGLDGVNISLDTLDPVQFSAITRRDYPVGQVLDAIAASAAVLPTKVNAVLLDETASQLIPLAQLAQKLPVDVRFIEWMPIGQDAVPRHDTQTVLERLQAQWPQLTPTSQRRGNGPARYYTAPGFLGCIGLIEAVSHQFCQSCNRVRVTSTGTLKPCLCYEDGVELLPLLRGGASQQELALAMAGAIYNKPQAHCFGSGHSAERRTMSQIGG